MRFGNSPRHSRVFVFAEEKHGKKLSRRYGRSSWGMLPHWLFDLCLFFLLRMFKLMQSKRIAKICLFLLVLAATIVMIAVQIRDQIRKTKTYDLIGKVVVTMDKTLFETNWPRYEAAKETKQMFPEVDVDKTHILDAWSRPLRIQTKTNDNIVQVEIRSAGKDGFLESDDDLVGAFTIKAKGGNF